MTYNYNEWLKNGKPEIFCKCGCGEKIILKLHLSTTYKYRGISEYIQGHNRMGSHLTNEHKNRLREYNLGKHPSESTRKLWSKIRKGKQCGNLHPNWNGGSSFLPYCAKFNNQKKDEIRKRDNYQCQHPDCLITQLENLILYKGKLHVHHIHYDKPNCNPDLITLCDIHNIKANYNRNYWEIFYMKILEKRGLI